ncbi:MAG: integration host factor subunit beta [Candidatus Aegiribacteria sp.]|nr:integration host factor subunit beta [Candidatus Aegiribacteria sp.]MBD3295227.1 integration host factor subunit beta [Candidatus Fermentibacteria bacterium]
MTKADIVSKIAAHDNIDLNKKDIASVVDGFLDEVRNALYNHKHIEIRRFGTFKVVERKKRIARNPHTGEAVEVPQRMVPVFKPSRIVKNEVAK